MKASEVLTEEQARQVSCPVTVLSRVRLTAFSKLAFDVDHAYAEFFRSLGGEKNDVS